MAAAQAQARIGAADAPAAVVQSWRWTPPVLRRLAARMVGGVRVLRLLFLRGGATRMEEGVRGPTSGIRPEWC